MKKKITKQIRVSLRDYETVRRLAYRSHKPMTLIISELIASKV